MTGDQSVLRTNLALSMLQVILHNQNRKQPDLKLFEIGKIYYTQDGKPKEDNYLCLAVTGNRYQRSWEAKPEEVNFFDLKGVVQSLAEILGMIELKFSSFQSNHFSSPISLKIENSGNQVGELGLIARPILDQLDIKNNVFLAELNLDKTISAVEEEKIFQPLPKYPPVERDIAIIVDKSAPALQIIQQIKAWAKGLAEEVGIFDVYSGKQVPPDKKSLAFYIRYRSADRTLTEEEVNTVQEKIIKNLQQEFQAQLRS